ncbi:MAG: hypothetical protein HA494_06910 [Thaumarchaeota archaeon]|nr:hypothetical protein [Nitrososphaerota archaeon]
MPLLQVYRLSATKPKKYIPAGRYLINGFNIISLFIIGLDLLYTTNRSVSETEQ